MRTLNEIKKSIKKKKESKNSFLPQISELNEKIFIFFRFYNYINKLNATLREKRYNFQMHFLSIETTQNGLVFSISFHYACVASAKMLMFFLLFFFFFSGRLIPQLTFKDTQFLVLMQPNKEEKKNTRSSNRKTELK